MKYILPYYLIGCLLLVTTISCAQTKTLSDSTLISDKTKSNNNFSFHSFIPGDFIYMNVDVLDNLYLITAGNRLKKINSKGDSLAVFNDVKKYGNPSYIDVSNPLKIIVYYKNFSTVVILDRLLIYRNSINLRKQNIFNVQAVATSYDNNVWVFDEQDFKIKKIDEEGKLLQESTDLRILADAAPAPSQIIDHDNKVYVYDENKGFYVFDYYGALKNNLPYLHWKNTAISRNYIYGFVNNQLNIYDLETLQLKQYEFPPFIKDYESIKAINGKLYLLKKEGIEIYSLQ